MQLDFKGVDLVLEDEYNAQIERCMAAVAQRALEDAEQLPSMKIHRGDPIDQIGEIIRDGLPAHVRPSEFARIRAAESRRTRRIRLARAAARQRYVASLVSFIPSLAGVGGGAKRAGPGP